MTNNDKEIISEKEAVNIDLHLNEYDVAVMSDFQKDLLKDELAQLPVLQSGEVSISGTYAFDMGDKIEVSVYLRNGLSVQINFDKVPLVITNKNGDIIGKQVMDMKDFGILPPLSGRPYKVYFDKTNLLSDTISNDDFMVQFENSIGAINTVKVELENLAEDMEYELKSGFIKFLDSLPLIKAGDVNIEVYKTLKCMDNSISIVFMIRNGCDKAVKLERLPILVKDQNEEVVAKGIFDIENISVNPHKARVYDFTITDEYIVKKDYDLSNCKVYFKSE